MAGFIVPMIVRGEVITDRLVEFGSRQDGMTFLGPDPHAYAGRIPLANASKLADLYQLSIEDIFEYLEALGQRLNVRSNSHMQEARAASYLASPLTPPLIDSMYEAIPALFSKAAVREVAEKSVGIRYLESWVPDQLLTGQEIFIRAFGSRALHIVAGNAPLVCVCGIIRNAISRSDAIIKTPSNDPMTATAIARTMVEMDKDHPLTKHIAVAYWKGGDTAFEEKLYQPQNIEKIVAWGGYASIKHVSRYIQPGLEIISLDPKRSASIVGREAFRNDETIRDVARRIAADVGFLNQNACINARVVYVQSGTNDAGIKNLSRLGALVYDALITLPTRTSTKPKRFDRELKANIDSIKLNDEFYHVIGGDDGEGAVIVSRIPDAVSFATGLIDRVVNLVPVDDLQEVMDAVDSYTQTVGIFPEDLKVKLRDILPLFGAQRFVSLGYAGMGSIATPQDAIEPLRRMCKWIVDERSSPSMTPPLWL
jgi:hypothetical protein